MAEIIKNRTVRPSTRKDSSVNYRVDIKGINASDTLIVNITHKRNHLQKHLSLKEGIFCREKALALK